MCVYFIIILLTGLQNSQMDVKEYFIAGVAFQPLQLIFREPSDPLRQPSLPMKTFLLEDK